MRTDGQTTLRQRVAIGGIAFSDTVYLQTVRNPAKFSATFLQDFVA